MHSIHTTPGFIVNSKPYGEAGKMLSIFTRNLGFILAIAQGIRFEKSKLRNFTQDYSFGVYSFVRGKEVWRLTNAGTESIFNPLSSTTLMIREIHLPAMPAQAGKAGDSRLGEELIARIALLLRRLLHGEEAHPELFDIVEKCNRFLYESKGLIQEQLKTLESLTVYRILLALGYIGNVPDLNELAAGNGVSEALLGGMEAKRKAINEQINKALKESHL